MVSDFAPSGDQPQAIDELARRIENGERDVVLPEGPHRIPVYRRERLGAGHVLAGPCLIESNETTILVPTGTSCEIDTVGTAVIT